VEHSAGTGYNREATDGVRRASEELEGRMSPRILARRSLLPLLCGLLALLCAGDAGLAQESPQGPKVITLTARKYEFSLTRIDVAQDDVIRITLVAEDIPHSFTLDAYRIAKRAAPGKPVTFEFRADRAGTFPFYCNLTIDDGCRKMRGELVVAPRPR
jgi:cytochrome c oxidase subunit II